MRESTRVAGPNFQGRLLVSRPGAGANGFERSVVLVCSHTEEGAMGMILNRPAPSLGFRQVLEQLSIVQPGSAIELPTRLSKASIGQGGPVNNTTGYVLHTRDYHIEDNTMVIDKHVSLTASTDILRAMLADTGPRSALLAFGYTKWEPGQLERELCGPGWLLCPRDEKLIYGEDFAGKYDRALRHTGVGYDVAALVDYHGNA